MLTNTSLWNAQIFKKFEKVWKFSHLKKSAITFAQGCTTHLATKVDLCDMVSS